VFPSPFRAFLAFGDEFGDDFQGFRHHFVTSASNQWRIGKKSANRAQKGQHVLFAGLQGRKIAPKAFPGIYL
jgi:hypothetical protein